MTDDQRAVWAMAGLMEELKRALPDGTSCSLTIVEATQGPFVTRKIRGHLGETDDGGAQRAGFFTTKLPSEVMTPDDWQAHAAQLADRLAAQWRSKRLPASPDRYAAEGARIQAAAHRITGYPGGGGD